MNSLLVITTLDYQHEANQRIHHVVNMIGARMQRVVVIHFALSNRKSLSQWFKNSFPFSARESRHGKVELLKVNPLGNFPETFAKGLLDFPDSRITVSSFRESISRLLNLFGLYKSISTALCYLFVYFYKLKGERFDVALVEGPWEGLVGVFLKSTGKVKTLVYQDIDYIPGDLSSKIRRRLTEKIELFCMANANIRISCGKMLQELRQKSLKQKVLFIPNGVDYLHWQKARKKISHPPTLVYMGNIIDWTGLHWILEALPYIITKIPNIRLMIIGRGNAGYISKLKEMTKKFALESCVDFVGFVPYSDLPIHLRKADIGLATFEPIPLLRYAFPLKVVEYMSAGLPVIASKDTESARLVHESGCGISVRYGQGRDLSDTIFNLIMNRRMYKRCSDNAGSHSKNYSWEHLMDVQYDYISKSFRAEAVT